MSFDICPASDLVTQGFGCTYFTSEWLAPWCPSGRYHSGIDLGMTVGSLWHQPVFATRPGQIVAVGIIGAQDWGFANYLGSAAVCLKTHDAYLIYGHLDVASVTVGQTIQVGAQIGLVGTRGNSTGPHLHFEARTDGARQNVWQNAAAVLDPRPHLNCSTGGTAGSEVIIPQEEPMTLSEKWAHIRTQFLIAEPDIAPDNNLIGSWATKIADDGNNVDAVIQTLWSTLPQFAAYRNRITALLNAGPAPAGPAGPPGPPGVTAPHKHTVSGIAEINT